MKLTKKLFIIGALVACFSICGCNNDPDKDLLNILHKIETGEAAGKVTPTPVDNSDVDVPSTYYDEFDYENSAKGWYSVDDLEREENTNKSSILDDYASTYTIDYVDNDGYQVKVSCVIYPWVLQNNNRDVLEPTWQRIVNQRNPEWRLPYFSSDSMVGWGGLTNVSANRWKYKDMDFDTEADDLYYSIGYIKLENVTPGFENKKINVKNVGISCLDFDQPSKEQKKFKYQIFGRLFGGTNQPPLDGKWGASASTASVTDTAIYPFILVFAEQFTPNHPTGNNYETGVIELPHWFLAAGTKIQMFDIPVLSVQK